jgi:hypothetical protein
LNQTLKTYSLFFCYLKIASIYFLASQFYNLEIFLVSSFNNFVQPSQLPAEPILNQSTNQSTGITICCEDRWQVYHRLQELDIRCECSGFQPLKVDIKTATEAIQLWSILKRVSQPRQQLIDVLHQSWQMPCAR